MSFSIATWNINSVRLRMPLVEDFLEKHQPDVLCLQEIKCENGAFPSGGFRKLGYQHFAIHGQKGYHGVATISKTPVSDIQRQDYCDKGDARHVSALVDAGSKKIRVHNYYVPAGGDEADRETNPKFAHKMDFLEEMKATHSDGEKSDGVSSILVGDLNIAPAETDVWSHKQLLKVVSHTPIEVDMLNAVQTAGGWHDLVRAHIPVDEKLFSWWSYRSKDWDKADKGRRLDHIWSSQDLTDNLNKIEVLRHARGWERPSDHVPMIVHLDV